MPSKISMGRVCRTCKEWKVREEFHKSPRNKGGIHTQCKECTSDEDRIKREQREPFTGILPKEKTCKGCKVLKEGFEFHRNSQNLDGLQTDCKQCQSERHIWTTYGLTPVDMQRMRNQQENCCAWCGEIEKEGVRRGLVVDHNHITQEIRRLLCHRCNAFEGQILRNWPHMINLWESEAWFDWKTGEKRTQYNIS